MYRVCGTRVRAVANFEEYERELVQDLKERDEFVERLKSRDKEKTNKVRIARALVGVFGAHSWLTYLRPGSSPGEWTCQRGDERERAAEEAAEKKRKLAEDEAARLAAMPDMRERSRQEYLQKRELQKIEQLKMIIREEERLVRTEKLTERERLDLENKKELLRLAEERMKLTDNVDHYQMPEGAARGARARSAVGRRPLTRASLVRCDAVVA